MEEIDNGEDSDGEAPANDFEDNALHQPQARYTNQAWLLYNSHVAVKKTKRLNCQKTWN